MDPNTKLKVGDQLVVMSLVEAENMYEISHDGSEPEIVFPEEKPEYRLERRYSFVKEYEGRTATVTRIDEMCPNHFHYFVDIDPEGFAWCPSMFSGYADDEDIEPPDPMSMWYFLGIEENRNPRKK